MWRSLLFFMIAAIFAASCKPSSVVTIYQTRDNYASNIHSVLVAGLVADVDTVTRSGLENYFALELNKAGYQAVSSLTAFGQKGLSNLGQEETMLKLCKFGFDAVLTIALIDGLKEGYKITPIGTPLAAGYYFDRIWNYRKILANFSNRQPASEHFWECVLFDLYSLQPIAVVQTKLFTSGQDGNVDMNLAITVIAKMRKEKNLRKRNSDKKAAVDRRIVTQ